MCPIPKHHRLVGFLSDGLNTLDFTGPTSVHCVRSLMSLRSKLKAPPLFQIALGSKLKAPPLFQISLRSKLKAPPLFQIALRSKLKAPPLFQIALGSKLKALPLFQIALRSKLKAPPLFQIALRSKLKAAPLSNCLPISLISLITRFELGLPIHWVLTLSDPIDVTGFRLDR